MIRGCAWLDYICFSAIHKGNIYSLLEKGVHTVILLLLTLIKEKCAQPTAVITPRSYNTSLDPEASFTFQCDVTGADSMQWLVDGFLSTRQAVRDRGISESGVVTVDGTTGNFSGSISITRKLISTILTL